VTERLFDSEQEAKEMLKRASGLEEGTLRIGADAAVHVLPLVRRFRARHPNISLRIVAGNSTELVERLAAYEIDLAVVAARPEDSRYQALLLGSSPLVAVGAAEEMGKRRQVHFEDLVRGPLVMREPGSATRSLLLEEMRRRGLTLPGTIEIEGREAANEAIAQGLGQGIASFDEVGRDPRLRACTIADWHTRMPEWLIWLENRSALVLMRAFLALAKERDAVE
jgi:LysR family transcriptional regulator, low CO2-responsive transcriptional regulator